MINSILKNLDKSMRKKRIIKSADIFCKVIDNFGDAGFSWRLAKALKNEKNIIITLWINELSVLQKICSKVKVLQEEQYVDNIKIINSKKKEYLPSDLVIEIFGSKLPIEYIKKMMEMKIQPVWINLEYLSAEPWIEAYHLLPSLHPKYSLKKYFFFPGFTKKTGGFLKEIDYEKKIKNFSEQKKKLFDDLGIDKSKTQILVSFFCYEFSPLEYLLKEMINGPPVICLIPEFLIDNFNLCDQKLRYFSNCKNIKIIFFPMLDQNIYDQLLLSCDLNFVRGEDSFIRAQISSKPFIWQPYKQVKKTHLVKLDFFLEKFCSDLSKDNALIYKSFNYWWNNKRSNKCNWNKLIKILPVLKSHGEKWSKDTKNNSCLVDRIFDFAENIS